MAQSGGSRNDDSWGEDWSDSGQAWSGRDGGANPFGPGGPGETPYRDSDYRDPSAADTGRQPPVSGDMWGPQPHSSGPPNQPHQPVPPGYPQPGQAPQGYPAGYGQPQQAKGGNGTKIALIVVLLLIIVPVIGVLGFMLATDGDGSTDAQGTDAVTSVPAGPGGDSGDSGRAEGFVPPSSWTECSGDGELGQLNYSYSATSVTTCEFSVAVRDAVAEHFHDTGGETSSVLNVRSPVTGESYTMTCNDDGTVVTCEGGNNAVVKVV